MKKKAIQIFKLAQPDGWDFYTGNTICYRSPNGIYPHTVRVPSPNPKLGICSAGVGHASINPNDCFVGARIPCSAYKMQIIPVCGDKTKYGWIEAEVLEEIIDLDNLFGWRYSEAIEPVNPLLLPERIPNDKDLELLRAWASVGASVWDSVWASVWDSVGASVRASVWASVWASVGASVWDSVWDSVGAYIGSLFPNVKKWKYIEHVEGIYPFQAAVDLWKLGLISSYDGKVWRLHSGQKAEIVWEGKVGISSIFEKERK